MINDLINALGERIESEINENGYLPFLKSVQYSPLVNVKSTDSPALTFCLTNLGEYVATANQVKVSMQFGIFIALAQTATVEESARLAQGYLWKYGENNSKDTGLIPWLSWFAKNRRITDSKRNVWRLIVQDSPQLYNEETGTNVRSAIFQLVTLESEISVR